MPVLTNIGYLATCLDEGSQGDVFPLQDAAVVWKEDRIVWVGAASAVPSEYSAEEHIDAGGRLVVPGLIDCHTHLAFGGWRADEFALRAQGASYLDIAKAGGGIASTVQHTREASADALYDKARVILEDMVRLGVTTVECKSGYGLTLEDELKVLRVYKALNAAQPVHLVGTLLAAHIVPEEYRGRRDSYIRLITEEMIPAVVEEELAAFCDAFVEETAFEADETRRIMDAAKAHGLRPKLHVDQLGDGNGGRLAGELGAISADHLEHTSVEGIHAMALYDVVAVSLPFATFNLRQQPMPARAFMEAGVPVAVATDFNPGSAPSYHLPAALYMACVLQQMTPAEALKGATTYAARAIGMETEVGQLSEGYRADLVVVDAPSVNQWLSHLRPNAAVLTVIGGKVVYEGNQTLSHG